MAVVLDDAERQSIREWFRGLVRARSAGGAPGTGGRDDGSRLTRDLGVPSDLASDVKGGTDSGSPPPPPAETDE
jgi:hypothetical protein